MPKKVYSKLNLNLVRNLKNKVKELNREKNFSESILNTMPDGFDIVDKKGNIKFMNKTFSNIFGKQAIGKKCWEIYRDDKKQCINCPLKKPINLGETKTIEVEGVAGGNIFLISHTGIELQDGSKALLEVFRDITKQKKAEQKLLHQKERYEKEIKELRKKIKNTK